MAPNSSRKRLPFEPTGKAPRAKLASTDQPVQSVPSSTSNPPSKGSQAGSSAIPEVVSQRMLRRMLAFSGVPTGLGVITFFASYYLVAKAQVELPPYAVLLVTLGCFGLGVVGLTYGVLSASWDEDQPGGWLGLAEFQVNFGRMTSAWGSKAKG